LEFLNSQPYYASKKLLSSHQIFRYAVPARTVTKKALVTSETQSQSHPRQTAKYIHTGILHSKLSVALHSTTRKGGI